MAHDGDAGIDAADGKNVNSGSPPRRGERIEETARVIGGRRPRCVRGRPDEEKSFPFIQLQAGKTRNLARVSAH